MCNTLSSQCLTLESIVLLLWSRTQLYKCCDLKVVSARKDVIPVPRHWDPGILILNECTRWLYNKNWIPVSATCMTPLLVRYSC
ncbi:MAG: WPE palindromic element domain-containing protein [Wolbachia sp.]|nr:WPE palindromic element domain-containing protein [Wolbachia endosymbiont of Aedes albopictus]UVW84223.1 WPE palindromic element domain-containing protein [Wolbachia endosymbiont of Aedes albopictus]